MATDIPLEDHDEPRTAPNEDEGRWTARVFAHVVVATFAFFGLSALFVAIPLGAGISLLFEGSAAIWLSLVCLALLFGASVMGWLWFDRGRTPLSHYTGLGASVLMNSLLLLPFTYRLARDHGGILGYFLVLGAAVVVAMVIVAADSWRSGRYVWWRAQAVFVIACLVAIYISWPGTDTTLLGLLELLFDDILMGILLVLALLVSLVGAQAVPLLTWALIKERLTTSEPGAALLICSMGGYLIVHLATGLFDASVTD